MAFEMSDWKRRAAELLGGLGGFVSRTAGKTPYAVYGGLCTLCLYPLVEALKNGEFQSVMKVLEYVADNTGGALIANQIQAWKDKSDDESQAVMTVWIVSEAPRNELLRHTLDDIVVELNAIRIVLTTLRGQQIDVLREELVALGNNQRYEAVLIGDYGVVIQGEGAQGAINGGVIVGQNASGDINTGTQMTINMEGGPYIEGDFVMKKITITEDQRHDTRGLPNPYLGLSAFTYNDRNKYSGRDDEIAQAMKLLTTPSEQRKILFVIGASGSGKTSFVQAGVLPRLEQYWRERHEAVTFAVMHPLRNPIAMRDDALLKLQTTAANLKNAPGIKVLVIDQAEELLTQSNSEGTKELVSWLLDFPEFAVSKTHIIVTLRSDYLGDLTERYAPLWKYARDAILLHSMDSKSLRSTITQPIKAQYGTGEKQLEQALIDQLVKDAQGDPSLVALLQVTLDDLWESGNLVLENYTNLANSISRRADKVLNTRGVNELDPLKPRPDEERRIMLKLLTDLVEVPMVGTIERSVRLSLPRSALVRDETSARLVDALLKGRLLAVSEGSPNEQLTLIHERLIMSWDQLNQSLNDQHEIKLQQARFRSQLNEWRAKREGGNGEDYLLMPVYLLPAQKLEAANDPVMFEPDAHEFVQASSAKLDAARQQELDNVRKELENQRRVTTRNKVIAVITMSALIGVSGLGIFAINQRDFAVSESIYRATAQVLAENSANMSATSESSAISESQIRATAQSQAEVRAKVARSRELAAIALSQIDVDPMRSLLIAQEAASIAETEEATLALQHAVQAPRLLFETPPSHGASTFRHLAYSTDGKLIATIAPTDTYAVQMVDATNGKPGLRLSGHADIISVGAFSHNSAKFAVGLFGARTHLDSYVRLWDMDTGTSVGLAGHTGEINCTHFSPDDSLLLTTSSDGTGRIWDGNTGAPLAVLLGHEGAQVSSCAFSPDGKRFVTTGTDGYAIIWSSSSFSMTHKLTHAISPSDTHPQLWTPVFSPDSKTLAIVGDKSSAGIWDVETGDLLFDLKGHTGNLRDAAFSPDGRLLVTVGVDAVPRLWNTRDGTLFAELRGHKSTVWSARFNSKGSMLVTASADATARVWDISIDAQATSTFSESSASRNVGLLYTLPSSIAAWFAEFSPDDQSVAVSGIDTSVRVWSATPSLQKTALIGNNAEVITAQFGRDGKEALTAGWDGIARIWDIHSGKPLTVMKPVGIDDLPKGAKTIYAEYDQSGEKIVVSGFNIQSVTVWNSVNGALLNTFKPEKSTMRVDSSSLKRTGDSGALYARFSPDGKVVAAAYHDGVVRLWSVESNQLVGELYAERKMPYRLMAVSFTPDGKHLVTTSTRYPAELWNIKDGSRVCTYESLIAYYPKSVTFSSDGEHIALADTGTIRPFTIVRLYDTKTCKLIRKLNISTAGATMSAEFNADGTKLIAADMVNGPVYVWDVASGELDFEMKGHQGGVFSTHFSPDSKWIVSSGQDGTVKVWDAKTGRLVVDLQDHKAGVIDAVFNTDSDRILTASLDGTSIVYYCDICAKLSDLKRIASQRAIRALTCNERVQFLGEKQACISHVPSMNATPIVAQDNSERPQLRTSPSSEDDLQIAVVKNFYALYVVSEITKAHQLFTPELQDVTSIETLFSERVSFQSASVVTITLGDYRDTVVAKIAKYSLNKQGVMLRTLYLEDWRLSKSVNGWALSELKQSVAIESCTESNPFNLDQSILIPLGCETSSESRERKATIAKSQNGLWIAFADEAGNYGTKNEIIYVLSSGSQAHRMYQLPDSSAISANVRSCVDNERQIALQNNRLVHASFLMSLCLYPDKLSYVGQFSNISAIEISVDVVRYDNGRVFRLPDVSAFDNSLSFQIIAVTLTSNPFDAISEAIWNTYTDNHSP